MTAVARVWHRLPGRLRIRVPGRRGDAAYFARAAEELAAHEAVQEVQANPNTGSLLLRHADSLTTDVLADFCRSRELFELQTRAPEPPSAPMRAAAGLGALDARLIRMSDGNLDVRSVVLVALLVTGLLQLSRGQVLAPAATLFWYALELITRSGARRATFAPPDPPQSVDSGSGGPGAGSGGRG